MKLFFLLLILFPLSLISEQTNVLIYKDTVQVSSEIYAYEKLVTGVPIQGSVMVTHDANNAIDVNSFRLGEKPLKVTLVQSVRISPYSPLMVTSYQFQLEAMSQGSHTLPPIKVNVGGKEYQAPPLTVLIPG
jgi:hypothetical protein